MGGISSLAQHSSWLVSGSVVHYSALTGEKMLLLGPPFLGPLLTLINIVFWGKQTLNRSRQYFCLFVTDKMLSEPNMGTYSLMSWAI